MTVDLRTDPFDRLRIDVDFADRSTRVSVRGEVDICTAGVVSGVLHALVDDDHLDLVVDAAGIAFMDATGADVVAIVARRLSEVDGSLTIRAASPRVRLVLDLTEVTDMVVMADSDSVVAPPNPSVTPS